MVEVEFEEPVKLGVYDPEPSPESMGEMNRMRTEAEARLEERRRERERYQ